MPVISMFLFQHCPYSNFFVISFQPSVLYDRVPYAMRNGTAGYLFAAAANFFSTNHRPGSVSLVAPYG
jgi:hypothetical protein